MNNIIEIRKLTKYYGKARGIIDLDLNVKKGDMFGFIGPNGAGKSTTIRILMGLINKSSGEAKMFDKSIVSDKVELLSYIGYLPSEVIFYSNMKVGEVIALSAKLHKKDCSKEAESLCERLELDTKRKVVELSLGNRKKLGIVCAFQHKPKLFVLDEPTSGLDPLIQKVVFEILEEERKFGSTIFISSHVLSEVQRYCNKVAIIREGRLVLSDTVESLYKKNIKRISLQGVMELPDIKGIKEVGIEKSGLNFLYQGDIKFLLEKLVELAITDINITEPDLEEIFMHFYEKGGDNNDNI